MQVVESEALVDSLGWLRELEREVAEANARGAGDRELAYALMAVRSGQPVGEELAEQADLIWRLAWVLNVRAPGLDPRWLVKGVLATDKVYWEVEPLTGLVQRVAELERAAAADHGEVSRWLREAEADPELAPIRRTAAAHQTIAETRGAELHRRVRADIEQIQRCVQQSDLLARVID